MDPVFPDDDVTDESTPSDVGEGATAPEPVDYPPGKLVLLGVGLEIVLVLVAWLCGRFGFNYSGQPWPGFGTEFWVSDVLIGTAAAGVLLWVVVRWEQLPNRLSTSFREVMREAVGPLFRSLSLWQIALISIAAGVGEELAFRWALQGGLAKYTTPWLALLIASVVFGLFHCVNLAYVLMATAMGLALGAMMIFSEGILMPVVCHAVYDFIGITYIARRR